MMEKLFDHFILWFLNDQPFEWQIFSSCFLKYFCRRAESWESDGWQDAAPPAPPCQRKVAAQTAVEGCCRDCRGLQAGTSSLQRLDYRLLLQQHLTCSTAVLTLHNNTKLQGKSNISCPPILTKFFAIRISRILCKIAQHFLEMDFFFAELWMDVLCSRVFYVILSHFPKHLLKVSFIPEP